MSFCSFHIRSTLLTFQIEKCRKKLAKNKQRIAAFEDRIGEMTRTGAEGISLLTSEKERLIAEVWRNFIHLFLEVVVGLLVYLFICLVVCLFDCFCLMFRMNLCRTKRPLYATKKISYKSMYDFKSSLDIHWVVRKSEPAVE
jgi:hypothetical protein